MALYGKLALPLALGVSILTVSSVVAYYIFKREEEEDFDDFEDPNKLDVIELTVHKSIVPALIGRSGKHIKDIENKSGATIHFKKRSDEYETDVCIMRGRKAHTKLANELICEFVGNHPEVSNSVLTVPSWTVGKIIGHGGNVIVSIRERSGAQLRIGGRKGDLDNDKDRDISIKGSLKEIEMAESLIKAIVNREITYREIRQTNRQALRYPEVPPSPPRSLATSSSAEYSEESGEDEEKLVVPGEQHVTHVQSKRPVTGAPIQVYVSAMASPSKFWIQCVGPNVTQLHKLNEVMDEFYNVKDNKESYSIPDLKVGQVVAAVFRPDGKWYRARVHDLRPSDFDHSKMVADLFFLDYGDCDYASVDDLCELRSEYLRLRFLAIECFLSGTMAAPHPDVRHGLWHESAVERFGQLTQVGTDTPVVSRTCTYTKRISEDGKSERDVPGVRLFALVEHGELDIGTVLVDEGWAVENPTPVHVKKNGDLGQSSMVGMTNGRKEADVTRGDSAIVNDSILTSESSNSTTETSSHDGSLPQRKTSPILLQPSNSMNFPCDIPSISLTDETQTPTPAQNGKYPTSDTSANTSDSTKDHVIPLTLTKFDIHVPPSQDIDRPQSTSSPISSSAPANLTCQTVWSEHEPSALGGPSENLCQKTEKCLTSSERQPTTICGSYENLSY